MVITTALVTSLLLNLTQKGFEKAFETGGEKASEGAINWVKGLFYKNEEPKKALKELQDDPTNASKQEIAKGIIENSIEDNEDNLKYFEELIKTFQNQKMQYQIVKILLQEIYRQEETQLLAMVIQ